MILMRQNAMGRCFWSGKKIDCVIKQAADFLFALLLYLAQRVKGGQIRQQAFKQFAVARRMSLQLTDSRLRLCGMVLRRGQ